MIIKTSGKTFRLDEAVSSLNEPAGMRKIRAALVGFGEVNTPREIIERKCGEARRLLEEQGVKVFWTEPVSDDSEGKNVARAKAELAGKEFDLLIICVAGWIPSHAVIDVIDQFKHKPMLLWGLSGWTEDGRFVTTADQAGTTALRKPMKDLGYTFKYIVNRMGCPVSMDQVMSFARAARAAAMLRGARIGQMGYRDMRLYGTLYDGVSLRSKIGPEVEFFEMLEMAQAIKSLDAEEVARLVESVKLRWTFVKEPQSGTIENAVRLYLAIRKKIDERGYEAISLIDVDGVKKLMKFAPAGVFMLLDEEADVCTIPENDTLGAVTQVITRYLTGQIAAYLEFLRVHRKGCLDGGARLCATRDCRWSGDRDAHRLRRVRRRTIERLEAEDGTGDRCPADQHGRPLRPAHGHRRRHHDTSLGRGRLDPAGAPTA